MFFQSYTMSTTKALHNTSFNYSIHTFLTTFSFLSLQNTTLTWGLSILVHWCYIHLKINFNVPHTPCSSSASNSATLHITTTLQEYYKYLMISTTVSTNTITCSRWVWVLLFYNARSQKGHKAWWLTFLVLTSQITRSVKRSPNWTVSLVIAGGHSNFPRSFVWVYIRDTVHTLPPRVLSFIAWLMWAFTETIVACIKYCAWYGWSGDHSERGGNREHLHHFQATHDQEKHNQLGGKGGGLSTKTDMLEAVVH